MICGNGLQRAEHRTSQPSEGLVVYHAGRRHADRSLKRAHRLLRCRTKHPINDNLTPSEAEPLLDERHILVPISTATGTLQPELLHPFLLLHPIECLMAITSIHCHTAAGIKIETPQPRLAMRDP
jgi:hypothetical protein